MPTHSAWVLYELYVRAERTLIQKDQLASRSCQRCLRSGSHRHCCGSAGDCSRAYAWSRSPLHDVRQHARFVDRRSVRNGFHGRTETRRAPLNKWWSQTGSNRRPPACKAGALPTELWPRKYGTEEAGMVGLGRFELPTSRLSSARSNQLSYRPIEARVRPSHQRPRAIVLQRRLDSVGSSEKKEKRRRRNPANGSVRPDIERP